MEAPPQQDKELLRTKHGEYLKSFTGGRDNSKTSLEYVMMEHLKMQGVFWTLGSLDLLGMGDYYGNDASRKAEVVAFILGCFDEQRGGFGGNVGYDAHLLYTQHAIYNLVLLDSLSVLGAERRKKIIKYIASLQNSNGSFKGDEWGEVDTRYSYCAAVSLKILNAVHEIDVPAACRYIISTRNELDGGFGSVRGVESHAGYVFTALGTLSVLDSLHYLKDETLLAFWLSERQCDSGGLNGRPEKLADVCYSWWVLSSLCILNCVGWIDKAKLKNFILLCQDNDQGGIADHPNNIGDVYHTFFGLCGLSILNETALLGENSIHPVYALPNSKVTELNLTCSFF